MAKISGVLEYLKSLDESKDDDLVLMMDAYGSFNLYNQPCNIEAHLEADIWFQLPVEVLISRYNAANAQADARLVNRLGRAVKAEGLKQAIIFGAGKRCAPNQVHTVACYPIPESPLPDDLYGTNTDTIMGRNKITSLRQRYLNSGYVIGPVRDMRRMFERAQEKVDAIKDHIDWDNGSHGSDFMYHGSDQSVFNTILGEQEFQREVMRRRHRTQADKVRGIGKPPKATYLEGTLIRDPLNPDFTHEPANAKPGRPDEFGIGLDYFSELGQQTVNAEEDARWIRYDGDIGEQTTRDRHLFDCPSRVTRDLPQDIRDSRAPNAMLPSDGKLTSRWDQVPLYTNLCMDNIPVMIHHNGDKAAREYAWPNLWLQPHARRLMAELLASDETSADDQGRKHTGAGGAYTEGTFISWENLCPTGMEGELYRDVDAPPAAA